MKFLLVFLNVVTAMVSQADDEVRIRSHGDRDSHPSHRKNPASNFEAVLGLEVGKGRLRVRSRSLKEAAETLAAAEAAGKKAKELLKATQSLQAKQRYRDLESLETSLIPVGLFYFIVLVIPKLLV